MPLETILQTECRNDDGFRFVFELKIVPGERIVSQIVNLYHNDSKDEIGYFKVDGYSNHVNNITNLKDEIGSPYNLFHNMNMTNTMGMTKIMDMTIDLKPIYHKKGLSRRMMKYLFDNSEKYFGEISLDHNIYIDADGSAGFWDAIGMKPNRTYDTVRELRGKGFEKFISYRELRNWIDKKKGGKKTRKKRKTRKQLKSRKKRKTRKQLKTRKKRKPKTKK